MWFCVSEQSEIFPTNLPILAHDTNILAENNYNHHHHHKNKRDLTASLLGPRNTNKDKKQRGKKRKKHEVKLPDKSNRGGKN